MVVVVVDIDNFGVVENVLIERAVHYVADNLDEHSYEHSDAHLDED